MGRVVVLGSLSQDLHLAVARHPAPGETVVADGGVTRALGGKGANQAVAAAGAGAGVVMVGRVGDDGPGRSHRERLAGLGVDVTRLGTDAQAPTGTAVVVTDASGENTIVVAAGASARVGERELAALEDVSDGDVLLATLEVPPGAVAAAARLAAARGARVVVNLAPWTALPADVLALCDPLVVNEHEHALLLADLDGAVSGDGPGSLLVTTGAGGSRWGDEHVPADAVEVVDTTGAGDAYCGALAAALCAGADRRTAMVAATAAAAACVAHPGAQPA